MKIHDGKRNNEHDWHCVGDDDDCVVYRCVKCGKFCTVVGEPELDNDLYGCTGQIDVTTGKLHG